MFDNFMSLKVYRSDMQSINDLIEVKTLNEFYEGNYKTNTLPVFNYCNDLYIAGNVFFNKKTKSMLIFSFFTNPYYNGIKSIGFFHVKNFLEFNELASKIDIEFNLLMDNFDLKLDINFIKLNECSNINEYELIGNIILNQEFLIDELTELYKEWSSSIESSLKKISLFIYKLNILKILVNVKGNWYNPMAYINYHTDNIGISTVLSKDFKFHAKLWTRVNDINVFSHHNQINLLKNEYKDKGLEERYIVYFDKNKCESVISFGNESSINNRNVLEINTDNENVSYYEVLREEDEDKTSYLNEILYFIG